MRFNINILRGEIKDRIESQEEIDSIIEISFKNKPVMDEKDFISCIENVRSEIFIYVFYLFYY